MEEDIKNMSKEELLEYLEDISQQLDNIALDQIQFAISELQFFKEEYKKLEEKNKRERDYYKLRFEELNKQWNKVIHKLLGENYYNYGCDWKTCDEFTADDLIYKYKKRWWQFWKKR